MTDPRIEAAARAIAEIDWPMFGWDEINDDVKFDLYQYAQVALAAADAAAWRPIETAPKDKTHVDLWVINSGGDGHRLTDAYFGPIPHTCGEYGQYCDSCPEEGNFWIDGLFGEQIFGEIISWQPLPAPPKAEVTE